MLTAAVKALLNTNGVDDTAADRRLEFFCYVALIAASLAAASSAFRVDEPNLIAIARQLSIHPFDPYGFAINWLGTAQPAWSVLANPPLLPAWMAIWASLFGWSEWSLHLSVLPFTLLAVWSMFDLGRTLFERRRADLTAQAALLTPTFVLGSVVVMPDVAAFALSLFSLSVAFRIGRRGVPSLLLAAGVTSAAAAILVKYSAVVFVVPLVVLFLARRSRALLLLVTITPITLLIWSCFTWSRYGEVHFLHAGASQGASGVFPLPGALSAFGLATFPLLLAVIVIFSTRRRLFLFATVAGALLGATAAATFDYAPVASLLTALAFAVAVRILCVAFEAPLDLETSVRWALTAWLLAAVCFQGVLRFSSARYTLPMLVPAVLLVMASPAWKMLTRINLGVTLLLLLVPSALLLRADVLEGNLSRRFMSIAASGAPHHLYFAGHWGSQLYLTQIGGVQYDTARPPLLQCGDRFVAQAEAVPEVRSLSVAAPCHAARRIVHLQIATPVRTIDCEAGANFYGNAIGGCSRYPILLPFGFSSAPDAFIVEDAVH